MPRVSLRAGALGFALVLLSPAAWGEDAKDQSRAAFRRGVALVKDGDYRSARDRFIEAYRFFAHPSILLNLGITRWRIGEFVDAEQDLAKFLSDDGGASQEEVASARAALAAVRTHLGDLKVRVAPGGARARLDAQVIALVPGELAEVRAQVGKHVLVAEAEGYQPHTETVVIESVNAAVVDVTLRALPEGGAVASARHEAPPAGFDGRQAAGWILVSTAALAVGTSVITGVRARALADEYNRQPAGAQDASTRGAGIAFRTATDLAIVTAAVTASIGVYLLLTPTSNAQLKIAAGPGFTGFQGRF